MARKKNPLGDQEAPQRRLSRNQLKDELHDIFKQSQFPGKTPECVKDFLQIYKPLFGTPQFDDFMQVLLLCIKAVLASERTSPYTKRSLDFIAACFKQILVFEEKKENERLENVVVQDMNGEMNTTASSLTSANEDDLDDLAAQAFDPDQTIVNKNYLSPLSTVDLLIKTYFVKYLVCENCNIRYNTLSLIKKTLEAFSEIDEGTFLELRGAITDRTFDKEKTIRALACLTLEKLQNSEKNDPALKTLKFHLLRDPDATVRLCALKTIEVNSESLRGLFLASRDESITIRKTAYSKIALQCEILNFSIENRHTLLMNGINERVDSVKEVVLRDLIPSWIERLNGDLLKFLEYMNIKKDLQFSENLLMSHFGWLKKFVEQDGTKFHKLAFDFKEKYLDEYNLFTKTNLTEEGSFLWLILCTFCKKNNVTYKKREEGEESLDAEGEQVKFLDVDLLDEIIPDIPNYCEFIDRYVKKIKEEQMISDETKFIFTQLLKIGKLLVIRDEAQWRHVLGIFKKIIQEDEYFDIFEDYIEHIIEIFGNYYGTDHERFLDLLYDMINAINNPHLELNNVAEEDLKRKLEEFETHLDVLYEAKSNAIFDENPDEVVRIKKEIDQVVQERQKIIDSQMASEAMSNVAPRMETDSKVFLRCLHIFYGFFYCGKLKKDIARLPTMINKLILPGLKVSDSKIRTLCIKNLGLYCMPSLTLITHFIKVFIEIVHNEHCGETRVEALKFIFDFLCYHGFTNIKFITHDYKNNDRYNKSSNLDDSENILARCNEENFIEVFSEIIEALLDEPEYDREQRNAFHVLVQYQLFEVAVKGLCKVMELGRFYSNSFLARLIIIFYTFDKIEPSLKQFIEGFFFSYAVNFPRLMQQHFGVGNAFVDSYEICLTTLYQEMNVDDRDGTLGDKLINFFTSMIEEEQIANLVLKAASMLTEEHSRMWSLNLKLIDKADLKPFPLEKLTELQQFLSDFRLNNAPVQPAKKGRGIRTGDKNVDLAAKILNKVRDKVAAKQQQQRMDDE